MTRDEAARQILGAATFDTALPQDWGDDAAKRLDGRYTYHEVLYAFVWADDERHGFGRPCALTPQGNDILHALNRACGSSYPLTAQPVEEG